MRSVIMKQLMPISYVLCVVLIANSSMADEPGDGPRVDPLSTVTLGDLAAGKTRVVDLSHALNRNTPQWPGENYSGFQLRTIATLEKDGVLSKMFSTPEHLGTHLDAPNHFEANQPSVEKITAEKLIGPGIVIDVRDSVRGNPDYQLPLTELDSWEEQFGKIPEGAIVLLLTGWGEHYTRYDRYQNRDAQGTMHFPGYSAEAASWLVEKRKIRGLGIDTLSIDPGISKDFAVHHVVNGAGKYALENVARLEELPARDFLLIVAPIKIETGSGGPTRIWAVYPD